MLARKASSAHHVDYKFELNRNAPAKLRDSDMSMHASPSSVKQEPLSAFALWVVKQLRSRQSGAVCLRV